MKADQKPMRCPMGVPGGIIAALAGLAGIIVNAIHGDWMNLALSAGLFLMALPFVRVTMMVHSANDRLDEIEAKMAKKVNDVLKLWGCLNIRIIISRHKD